MTAAVLLAALAVYMVAMCWYGWHRWYWSYAQRMRRLKRSMDQLAATMGGPLVDAMQQATRSVVAFGEALAQRPQT